MCAYGLAENSRIFYNKFNASLSAIRAYGMKMVDLTLPDFAFVDGRGDENDKLSGRIVLLHVRSASVIEIFEREDVVLDEEVLTYKFSNINKYKTREKMVAALHYCATLSLSSDWQTIKDQVLIPAAKWYCDYCEWEDERIYL